MLQRQLTLTSVHTAVSCANDYEMPMMINNITYLHCLIDTWWIHITEASYILAVYINCLNVTFRSFALCYVFLSSLLECLVVYSQK